MRALCALPPSDVSTWHRVLPSFKVLGQQGLVQQGIQIQGRNSLQCGRVGRARQPGAVQFGVLPQVVLAVLGFGHRHSIVLGLVFEGLSIEQPSSGVA